MQERRISFDELWHGLALDREYGPKFNPETDNRTDNTTCLELLKEALDHNNLTEHDFRSVVRAFGCHNMLIRVWLGYEGLPFYFPGQEQPVRGDIDGIKPMTFLEEIDCRKVEIRKIELAHFLFMKDLPLPAPDVKDRSLWFHGNPASTEFRKIGEDPYDVHDQDFWNLMMKKFELEHKKEKWELTPAPTAGELKIKEDKLEEIDAELDMIRKEFDAGSNCTEEKMNCASTGRDQKKDSRNIARIAVMKFLGPSERVSGEDYQDGLHHRLSGVNQVAAYEWCRYYHINGELKKLEKEGQPGEWRDKKMIAYKKEMQAIIDWTNNKRDSPTNGSNEVVDRFPPCPLLKSSESQSNDKKEGVKKLRPCQKHKQAVRDVAKKIWDSEPDTTIADMAFRDEISRACESKKYKERTIRLWIKDLCPDRNPGRRPKNNPRK